jgi:hypothetical protein
MRIHWYQYFALFSLLWAIYCHRGLNAFSIGIMIPLLLLDNLAEIIASNWRYLFHLNNNYFIYNLYLLLSTPLFFSLFAAMLDLNQPERRRLFWTGVAIEVFILLNYFFIQRWTDFNTYSLLVAQTANIILSCLVLARLAIRKDDESGLLQDPYFWINAMILLFSLVTVIVLGMQKYIAVNHIEIRNKILYSAIMPAANAVLYTGYSCAFLLCQIQKNK